MLMLNGLKPFAQGGRRICYDHPDYQDRCVKVRRPDRSLEYLRSRRSFPKNLMPLSSFDDSLEEHRIMSYLDKHIGEPLYQHVNRCFGFEQTDMGEGLVCELIKDGDGQVSQSLRQHINEFGYSDACRQAVEDFCQFWLTMMIPYRGNFRLENLVVQKAADGTIQRLVVIDDIGHASSFPLWMIPKSYQKKKSKKKVAILKQRVDLLLSRLASQ